MHIIIKPNINGINKKNTWRTSWRYGIAYFFVQSDFWRDCLCNLSLIEVWNFFSIIWKFVWISSWIYQVIIIITHLIVRRKMSGYQQEHLFQFNRLIIEPDFRLLISKYTTLTPGLATTITKTAFMFIETMPTHFRMSLIRKSNGLIQGIIMTSVINEQQ